MFQTLIDNGATVIVIEHDLDVIRNGDYVIDMGPGGGEEGGQADHSFRNFRRGGKGREKYNGKISCYLRHCMVKFYDARDKSPKEKYRGGFIWEWQRYYPGQPVL